MTQVDEDAPEVAWDEPTGLTARGTLLIIPGRGEEPSLYERFGRRLSADAYRVRVLHDPTDDAALTLAQVTGQLASPATTAAPRVLVGSDTGALYAAALAAVGDAGQADALILAGLPTVSPTVPPAARPVATGQSASEPTWDDELEARTSCPTHRGVLARSAVRRGALFGPVPEGWLDQADLSQVKVPVLGIHGAADPVSSLARARERYRQAPAAQLVSIADGRHDVLNDVAHRTAAATVVLFLERLRLGGDLPVIATSEQLEPAGA
jgi:alpha-beta hydrolase superfamily lysophospholipase